MSVFAVLMPEGVSLCGGFSRALFYPTLQRESESYDSQLRVCLCQFVEIFIECH